jgi:molybdopterin-guanine dinucleotide biosynthesis protein MobB
MSRIPIICFAAPSGTGKTTLIERVIGCLAARGLRVGAIKHDAHKVELDRPGKDSWRLRHAGAVRTILAASNQLAVFDTAEQSRSVRELAEQFFSDVDVVIAEGFRTSGEPTIIVERVDGPIRKDWEPPVAPIAIVSDGLTAGTLPVLGLNAPDEVAAFICQQFGIGKREA